MAICLHEFTLSIIFDGYFSDCTPVQQAQISSENDTLTVTWSTYVVYHARVTRVPDDINKRVRERLLNSEADLILKMVIINGQPP